MAETVGPAPEGGNDAAVTDAPELPVNEGGWGPRLPHINLEGETFAAFNREVLETYREYYEDGRTRLVQEYYSNGTKRYEDVISEDGIEESTDWFENGAIKSHNVWKDGLQTLHETFQDNGNRYSLEIHRPDGTYTTRRYDGEGRADYEDDYTSDTYYDRRFSEGRMFLERRTRRADDVYLGSTEWEYFEEGGVKKIRISENDENGVQTSQTVIPDDGKTGYPEEL